MKQKTEKEIVEEIIQELKEMGKGPLTLGMHCTKCGARFGLDKKAVAMAWAMETPFMEYLKDVQSSKCPACGSEPAV